MSTNIVFPPNSESNPGFPRFGTLLTAAELKAQYLHGIKFTDASGNNIDESAFTAAIGRAISDVEHHLNMTITPTTYTERIDYDLNDYNNYGFMQLNHRPVLSITSVKLQLIQGQDLVDFPAEWIRLYSESGQIQLTPTSGTVSGFNISNSGFLPMVYGVTRNFPQLIEVTYVAGFEQNKIPNIVNGVIGTQAAIKMLAIAGDLVLGAGIASQSISMDGLSQSVNAALSGDNGAYAGRIKQYTEELTDKYGVIKNYYHGINFRVS